VPTYIDKTDVLGVGARLMVAVHYLKYQHDSSDEAVEAGWVGKSPNNSTSAGGSILSMRG
jgi:hypothetical protein